jgi:DNA topoisomerase-1
MLKRDSINFFHNKEINMKLMIVESPGKIKTIQSFLPRDFLVKASVGHCYTIERTDNGIDIENKYKPNYVIIDGKQKVVDELKKLSQQAEEVLIATDADREGESIGTHIAERVVKDPKKVKRIKFQEITKNAILKALEKPTTLDKDLFEAQQARSVLDMLVGFKVSPVLWSKVKSGTSAGRVQSIGLRLIVERQREIDKFVPKEYWTIPGVFETQKKETLKALYHVEEEIPNETICKQIESEVRALSDWYVASITKTTKAKSPFPVFNTSSLQQFCSSTFNWDGKHTMSLAQKLYEGGHISYHRTDSLNISVEAISNVRELITKSYGKEYCPSKPREFKTKNKVAQEAHEGIRPTHLEKTLDEIKSCTTDQEFKLYEAIYARFLACQMSDAQLNSSKVVIQSKQSKKHEFIANGQIIKFDGFLKVWTYSNTKDEDLPQITENDKLEFKELKLEQHFTKPPAAFNTASLVKVLEEEGIGRPSTYAGIIDTLIKRTYVEKDGKAFKPTELGCKISDFLVVNFPELMNTKFTARIEEQLDDIANGERVWHEAVDEFYKELKKRIDVSKTAESLKKVETTDIDCPACKRYKLVKRKGKFGDFYGCAGFSVRGKYKCEATFKIGENGEPVSKEKKEIRCLEGVVCDKCGSKIAIRVSTKTGKEFGGCSAFPKCRRLFSMDGIPIEIERK